MNNEKIIENFNEFDEPKINRVPFLEKRVGELKEIIECLNGLQKDELYIKLKKLLLIPRLDSFTKMMRGEAEPIKLYRIQGRLIELENLIELNQLVQILENEFNNLSTQIKSSKDETDK